MQAFLWPLSLQSVPRMDAFIAVASCSKLYKLNYYFNVHKNLYYQHAHENARRQVYYKHQQMALAFCEMSI
jgi:hypothetical protein